MEKELDFLEDGGNEASASLDDILNMDISGLAPEQAEKSEGSSVEDLFGGEGFSLDTALDGDNFGDIFGGDDVFGAAEEAVSGNENLLVSGEAAFASESDSASAAVAENTEILAEPEAVAGIDTIGMIAEDEAGSSLEPLLTELSEAAGEEIVQGEDAFVETAADEKAYAKPEIAETEIPSPSLTEADTAAEFTEEDFLSVPEERESPFTAAVEDTEYAAAEVEPEDVQAAETDSVAEMESAGEVASEAESESDTDSFLISEDSFEPEDTESKYDVSAQAEEELQSFREESNLDEFRTVVESETAQNVAEEEILPPDAEVFEEVPEDTQNSSELLAAGGVVNFAEMDGYDEEKTGFDDAESACFLKWYSGTSDDEYFKVSKESESSVLKGDRDRKAIHVNAGYDTYGWQVQFDNGINMNLRDVREYQLRNGKLPNSGGIIVYGNRRSEFSNIERIVVYEEVQYFSYA